MPVWELCHNLPLRLLLPQKMRRMHGVAQANGQRTVGIEDMLAQVGAFSHSYMAQ